MSCALFQTLLDKIVELHDLYPGSIDEEFFQLYDQAAASNVVPVIIERVIRILELLRLTAFQSRKTKNRFLLELIPGLVVTLADIQQYKLELGGDWYIRDRCYPKSRTLYAEGFNCGQACRILSPLMADSPPEDTDFNYSLLIKATQSLL